ncbi:MAG: hypothetical protein LBV72_11370 [Tannerella sp.]|nr:hypothetical protein [Tannerella sp.]
MSYRQTQLYFRLKSKSYYRLWKEFPWVIRLLLLGGFLIITYILIISHLDASLINYTVVSCVYILLGLKLCRLNPSEAVLLKVLRIPQIQIRLIKCLLLSMPFFLLDIYAGLIALILGTGIVMLIADKRPNRKAVRSFYKATSYQWLSMFRSEGCWLLLAGLIFLMVALFHGNRNMACFSLVWLFLIPCSAAYYNRQKDPKQWLRVYKNVSFLMRKKITEVLQNILILLVVCVPLVLIFDWSAYWLYTQLFLLLIMGNVVIFHVYYACYPGMLTAIVLTGIVIFILYLLYVLAPVFFIPAGLFLLVILHIISIQNLKSAIYGTTESTH